jgi:hypothetical protein
LSVYFWFRGTTHHMIQLSAMQLSVICVRIICPFESAIDFKIASSALVWFRGDCLAAPGRAGPLSTAGAARCARSLSYSESDCRSTPINLRHVLQLHTQIKDFIDTFLVYNCKVHTYCMVEYNERHHHHHHTDRVTIAVITTPTLTCCRLSYKKYTHTHKYYYNNTPPSYLTNKHNLRRPPDVL